MRDSVNTAEKIREQAVSQLNTLGTTNIQQVFETSYGNLDELYAKAERRLKRMENSIKRQAKALQQKEQNVQTVIDKAVQQRVEQEINRIDGEIYQKRSKLDAMDVEISSKGKILTEMNVSLWTSQSFLRQSELNMKRANDLIKEWSERNASENDRPTIPQR